MLKIDLTDYKNVPEPDEIEPSGEDILAEGQSDALEEPFESLLETLPSEPDEFPADDESSSSPPLSTGEEPHIPVDGELPFPEDDELPFPMEESTEAGVEETPTQPEPLDPFEEEGSAAPPEPPEASDFSAARNERTVVEKIPLSSKEPAKPSSDLPAVEISDPIDTEPPSKGGSRMRTILLVIILLIAAGYGVYTQRGRITGLIVKKPASNMRVSKPQPPSPAPVQVPTDTTSTPPAPVQPPAGTPVTPEPTQAAGTKAPERTDGSKDPTIAGLSRLRRAAPPRVWIAEVSISADGVYQLKGISFSHEAMRAFSDSLKTVGTVTTESIPARSTSPETVYSFGIAGKLRDAGSIGVFEVVPSDRLAAIGDSLKAGMKSGGIIFARLPRANAKYGEADLPFEAVGALDGIMGMLGGITSSGKVVVFRIAVTPAAGVSADRIRAGFSLRSVPSL